MYTKDVILLVCSFMLGVVASNLFFKRKYDCTYKVITNVDTLYVQNVDTIFQKDIEYITEKVVDTLYITNVVDSVVKLPVTQKHYKEDSLYDAWVSGYEPSLDSISVYGKTETRFVTETKTIEKNSSRLNIYPYVMVFSVKPPTPGDIVASSPTPHFQHQTSIITQPPQMIATRK